VLHQHLPQQRALPEELKAKVSSLMRIRANKKLLQEQISPQREKSFYWRICQTFIKSKSWTLVQTVWKEL